MDRKCERCREELSLVRPGQEMPAVLSAHLELCAACRNWREQDAAAWAALGVVGEAVPAPGLVERIVNAPGHARPQQRFGTWLRLAAAGAALAGGLAGAWLGSELSARPAAEPAKAPEEVFLEMFDAAPTMALGLPAPEGGESGRLP